MVNAVSRSLIDERSPILFNITAEDKEDERLCAYSPNSLDKGVEVILILLVLNHDEKFWDGLGLLVLNHDEKFWDGCCPSEAAKAIHILSDSLTLSEKKELTSENSEYLKTMFGTADPDVLGSLVPYDDGLFYEKKGGGIEMVDLNPFLFRIELQGWY